MKILTVCDHGNNRSVTLAHRLKYWDHDVIAAGLAKNSSETLTMLFNWADKILLTCHDQSWQIPDKFKAKVKMFNIGPDNYPRPFNPALDTKVKQLLEENKSWLKN